MCSNVYNDVANFEACKTQKSLYLENETFFSQLRNFINFI